MNCSFAPSPSQLTLYPGDVGEYLSQPLMISRDEVLEGHLVMRTVPGNTEFQVNLPQVTLEAVSFKQICGFH